MRKPNESTLKMKANLMNLKKQGYTNPQIAAEYGCTLSTVHRIIKQIAQETGKQREELLDKPHYNKKNLDQHALKKQRDALDLELVSLQHKRAARAEQRNRACEQLDNSRSSLKSLQQEVAELKARCHEYVTERNRLNDEIKELDKQIGTKSQKVDQLKAQIDRISPVEIHVDSDGTFYSTPFDCFAKVSFNKKLFKELVEDKWCENLLVKQVRTLTCVLTAVSKLKKMGRQFKVICEESGIDIAYRALID